MSMPKACCTLPPVISDYEPKGRTIQIDGLDMDIYETADPPTGAGGPPPHTVLLCAYDIFGFHNVTKQVCDRLGVEGFKVVMPDFFRGQPLPLDAMPADNVPYIRKLVTVAWNMLRMPRLVTKNIRLASGSNSSILKVIQHYKEKENVQRFGCFGFCWGAKVCIEALVEIEDIKAGVLIHPSMWKKADAERIKKPTFLMPTRDEANMIPFYETLKKNLGEENCGHRRFDEMPHGFCAARGDLTNELNRQAVDEAIGLMHAFFKKHVLLEKEAK